MKPREHGFLKPDRMPEEVFDYIRECHEYLWRFCRAVMPAASGKLSQIVDECLFLAESVQPEELPSVLFDGYAVYEELPKDVKGWTSAENVSAVLDAVVRILRRDRQKPQEGKS